ncbi:MAG: DNA ligase D [Burkholderiaceae bacterium]|nr:DNA ligase D [Burkholderiaceae bacterium]
MPSPDPLQRYREKRDFRFTAEPSGPRASKREAAPALERVFVVQKHAARRLHYDFRLELDGALKSWAVPKGPSLDPHVKRMAVHVEDHPLDYADFEGTIPPKHYGAGTVIVWDRGTWIAEGDASEGYRDGKLKFELRGEKLHGRWTLVRMHGHAGERQEPWLLIKERDAFTRAQSDYSIVDALPDSVLHTTQPSRPPPQAREAALADSLEPQLATLVGTAPASGAWSWEMKFDGYRVLARIDGNDVRMITRNGHDWTQRMPSLARAVAALGLPSAWLDGEIVLADERGVASFQQLQNAFDSERTEDIVYYVFDLPYCAGLDLTQVALRERRALLREWLAAHPSDRVRFSADFPVAPEALLRSACELGVEGIIGKRVDSTYVAGRTSSWVKLKCSNRQEFVIGGYTDPQGSRNGFGALLLGVHDDSGALRYAGKVGSGFDEKQLGELHAQLKARETSASPFAQRVPERGAHWVRPELVAEVSFTQWTGGGRIRHGVFRGLRDDKPAAQIVRERPRKAATLAAPQDPAPDPRAARLLASVRVTNPERVIDATSGITKLDVVRYYALVAPTMMPHLKRRPAALVRAPDGIDGQRFFQKHASLSAMPGVRSLDPKYDPGEEPLIEIAGEKGLVTAAQMNAIEVHTWNATTRAIEKPDRIVFDLDPGEGVEWTAVREAAQLVQTLLDELQLRGFLKTSGGKGLHVVVPIAPKHGWDTVKDLSRAIVVHLARTLPSRFVSKSGASNRKGRIFADYLRNGRGATTVAAWSTRGRPGIGVSVPVAWEELPELTGGAHWTLRTIEPRLAQPDPWADYATTRQGIEAAMRALGVVTRTAASASS